MWYLTKIPKRLFLYWGKNKSLSLLRYYTVLSFHALNPDWEIVIYIPKIPVKKITWETNEQKHEEEGKDWFFLLQDNPLIKIVEFDFSRFKQFENASEVHRSDFIRLYLLSVFGGWWSDFDILYIKPMDRMLINKPENKEVDFCVCYNHQQNYNIGNFLGGRKEPIVEECFGFLMKEALAHFYDKEYQTIGRFLYDKFISFDDENRYEGLIKGNILNIPFDTVNPVEWNRKEFLFNDIIDLSENTIGIHWFAGGGSPLLLKGSTVDRCMELVLK